MSTVDKMRLLCAKRFNFTSLLVPKYAILSHCWGSNELSYQAVGDAISQGRMKSEEDAIWRSGFVKIYNFSRQALRTVTSSFGSILAVSISPAVPSFKKRSIRCTTGTETLKCATRTSTTCPYPEAAAAARAICPKSLGIQGGSLESVQASPIALETFAEITPPAAITPADATPLTEEQRLTRKTEYIQSIKEDAVCALASRHNNGLPCRLDESTPVANGSFNVCFFVEFHTTAERTQWVIRVPIEPVVHRTWEKVQSEVCTMR